MMLDLKGDETPKQTTTWVNERLETEEYNDKNGKIDARIYNAGLWLLRTNFNEWKRLENSFKLFDPKGVLTESEFAAVAFLWRGLPLKVSRDIFFIRNLECKNKDTISFKTFKYVATSYMQLEKSSQTTNGKQKLFFKRQLDEF